MPERIDKKSLLLRFLERGMAMVHVDARREGVRVPGHLAEEAHVALNLSWRFAASAMVVDEDGIRASLHFNGEPFAVALPWGSVFAIYSHVSGEGFAWPEDVPEDVARSLLSPVKETQPPLLRAVMDEPEEPPEPPPEPPRPRAPHLRLVK